jgi:hypothetical protein
LRASNSDFTSVPTIGSRDEVDRYDNFNPVGRRENEFDILAQRHQHRVTHLGGACLCVCVAGQNFAKLENQAGEIVTK